MPFAVDRALVERAAHDDEALDALIDAVWPDAYRLAACILHDHGLAEDAAQDACASIVRFLPALENSGAFAAWTYKIVVRHALAASRRRSRVRDLDARLDRSVAHDRSDALDLYAALARLSPQQRSVVLLHYYAGMSSVEIAETIGSRAPTVRFHLMLARRALRAALTASATAQGNREVLSDVL